MAAKLLKRLKKRLSKLRNKNASYFIQENVVQGNGDLKAILSPLPGIKPIETNRTIAIYEIPLNDITYKSLKNKFGYPSFILKNDHNIEKHKVYFYRDKVGHYKLLMQFHFIENQFFFGSTRISVPKGISTESKLKIVKQALIKYTSATERKQVKELDIKLIDENSNILFVFDYVSFYMNYLVNNDMTKKLYEEYCVGSDDETDNIETREEIDKYL